MTNTNIRHQAKPAAKTAKARIIDLSDSIPDITANLIVDSEHYQLPPLHL